VGSGSKDKEDMKKIQQRQKKRKVPRNKAKDSRLITSRLVVIAYAINSSLW
jgi:hypothetical protein